MSPMLQILTAASAAAQPASPPMWTSLVMWIPVAAVFWFLVLRPQMRRQKQQTTKIAGIKKGDQVVTAGGLLAKVIKVDDNYAELELGPNVRVKAVKTTLADVIAPPGSTAAND